MKREGTNERKPEQVFFVPEYGDIGEVRATFYSCRRDAGRDKDSFARRPGTSTDTVTAYVTPWTSLRYPVSVDHKEPPVSPEFESLGQGFPRTEIEAVLSRNIYFAGSM